MKKTLVILLYFCSSLSLQAQQKAVTETGDEVFLYENGTWEYTNKEDVEVKEIPINPEDFTKPEASTFLVKSTKLNLGIWLNPKKWSFKKAVDNPDAEFEFQLKKGDLYGMVLTEKFEIPLLTLKSIALENGKSSAPDLRIVKEEYRNVNGMKVLQMQMDGTMQGIKFSYYGYYFSSTQGTIQFITYTSHNLLDEYRSTCEELLNGLVEVE